MAITSTTTPKSWPSNSAALSQVLAILLMIMFYTMTFADEDNQSREKRMTDSTKKNSIDEGKIPDSEIPKTDIEWRKRLTREQFAITRKKGTERAFSGAYWNTKTPGTYRCICCG